MYNIHYDICALFVIAVELIIYYTRKSGKIKQNKVYILMAYVLLVATICDIISGVVSNSPGKFQTVIPIVANTFYFLASNALPPLFMVYAITLVMRFSSIRWWKRGLLFVPFGGVLAVLLINLKTGIVFTIDELGCYHRGPLMLMLYGICALYLVITAIIVAVNRKRIDTYRLVSVYVFFAFVIIPIVMQTVFPYLLVQCFGIAICFIVVFSYLEQRTDNIDSGLGVYNKKAFVELTKLTTKNNIPTITMSVTAEDINYLERSFGMETMSKLEQEIANYLRELCPDLDIYHMGDLTFYVVDQYAGVQLLECADALIKQTTKNWTIGEVEVPLDLDVGIIKCPEDFSSLEEIVDFTEYLRNEEHGRGSRVVFAKDMKQYAGKRKDQIRRAIQKALANETLEVYYQPIFSTEKQRVNSAEALVRLIDGELGFIPPDEFIPIAEEDGSILRIGEYVLEEVCRFIKEYDVRSKGIEYIEVNVSVIECMKYNMAAKVASMLNRYGLEPEQINLEITETAAMNLPHIVGDNMGRLVDYGVHFSLDDYGSGYSNINYLIELPFNLIKVDKSIVWSAFENEKAGIALASSIAMIRRLNFHIVAEGVETQEQVMALTNMGCDYLQGYYFSKPLPQEQFLQYIVAHA